jgi:hypothetical protein
MLAEKADDTGFCGSGDVAMTASRCPAAHLLKLLPSLTTEEQLLFV